MKLLEGFTFSRMVYRKASATKCLKQPLQARDKFADRRDVLSLLLKEATRRAYCTAS